jgi:hypothetical protein
VSPACSVLALLFFVSIANANPMGGTVTNGTASIITNGTTLNIDQSSQRAVIDWRSFNIAPNETTISELAVVITPYLVRGKQKQASGPVMLLPLHD